MSASFEWSRRTAEEIREVVGGGCLGLWAIGATEQHGAHLVTGFDFLAAEHIVRRVAGRLGDAVLVLPTLSFGSSDHWKSFGATISLRQDTLRRVIEDVCDSSEQAGLDHLVIVNGHAGNAALAAAILGKYYSSRCEFHFLSYWDLLGGSELADMMAIDSGVGHAGEFETSIGLTLDGAVRRRSVPSSGTAYQRRVNSPGIHEAVRRDRLPDSGVVGDPGPASAETGASILDLVATRIELCCRELMTTERPKL